MVYTPNTCTEIGGKTYGRYHIQQDKGEEFTGRIDYEWQLAIDNQHKVNFGIIRNFARLNYNLTTDEGNMSLSDAFIKVLVYENFEKVASFIAGKTYSYGNLTYGKYALNANYDMYHAENTVSLLGYSYELGLGTSFSVSIENQTNSSRNNLQSDFAGNISLNHDWVSIGVAGGTLSHNFKETENDMEHLKYLNLIEEPILKLGYSKDVSVFGYYIGGGTEFQILSHGTTKVGISGFFANAALSKIAIPSQQIAKRKKCTESNGNCQNDANAGRPYILDETGSPIYVSQEEYLTKGYNKNKVEMMTLFEDTSIVIVKSKEIENEFTQEIKSNFGFSINGGLSHSFNSFISLNVNGGFYKAIDNDWSARGFMTGMSVDYNLTTGLLFSIGSEFENISLSYDGKDNEIKKEFESDGDGLIDPSISLTFSTTIFF